MGADKNGKSKMAVDVSVCLLRGLVFEHEDKNYCCMCELSC